MNRETLVGYYDKLAALVEKLPGGLQKPIMHELRPIREVFLDQRPARILVLGEPEITVPEFLCRLAHLDLLESGKTEQGWRRYHSSGRGNIQVLDGRDIGPEWVRSAVQAQAPDLILLLRGDRTPENWNELITQAKLVSGIEPSKLNAKPPENPVPMVGVLTAEKNPATEQAFRAQLAAAGLEEVPIFALAPEDRELL
ncbi:MAG TPA: hypothetical protein VIS74_05755, partial [Chthoniobacterales bacterium]